MKRLLLSAAVIFTITAAPLAFAAERTVTLRVPGMDCAACPFIVSKALKRVTGVKSVKASLAKRTAVVVYDDAKTNVAALANATKAAGYNSAPAR